MQPASKPGAAAGAASAPADGPLSFQPMFDHPAHAAS